MTLRSVLKKALLLSARRLGLFALGRLLTRRGVMIVGWHGVSLDDEHQRFPSLFISAEEFERRIRFLCQKYTVISLEEAVRQMREKKIRPGQVVLTFDDGFSNFFQRAVPILEKYGVTATNYLVSERLIDNLPNTTLMVREMLLQAADGSYSAAGCVPVDFTLTPDADDRRARTKVLLKSMLSRPTADQRLQFAKDLADILGFDLQSVFESRRWHCLTAEEVRQLAARGYGMQLHTHRHQSVVGHAQELILEEVRTCRQVVEDASGTTASHFCYPSGNWEREAWPALRAVEIDSATTSMHGPNFASTPLLSLRRVLNGENRSQLEFEFQMSNLRWLGHVMFRPWKIFSPSQKRSSFRDGGLSPF